MKRLLPFILACLMLLASCTNGGGNTLSRGIDYLARKNKLEKCTVFDRTVSFDRAEFEQNCSFELSYAVIASVPDSELGTLTLNGSVVKAGQTLQPSQLGTLKFIPCGKAGSDARFSVICRDGYGNDSAVNCVISISDRENRPPVAYPESISAISGVPVSGDLHFEDPDGDAVTLSIDVYPAHGSMDVGRDGGFVYVPDMGYSGDDVMVFTVTDRFGLTSSSELSIKTAPNPKALVFEDVDSSMHYDCVRACLADIMTYSRTDGKYIFSPDEEPSRIDFLVMLMTACGVENIYSVRDTVFEDDGGISDGRKAYLAKAAELGIVDVTKEFDPFGRVSKAQAAVWIKRALDLPEINAGVVCADIAETPDWAAASVKAALACGVMKTYRGYLRPNSAVTKGYAAQIFTGIEAYKSNE